MKTIINKSDVSDLNWSVLVLAAQRIRNIRAGKHTAELELEYEKACERMYLDQA